MFDINLRENEGKRLTIFFFKNEKNSFNNDKNEDLTKFAHLTLKPKHVNECENPV